MCTKASRQTNATLQREHHQQWIAEHQPHSFQSSDRRGVYQGFTYSSLSKGCLRNKTDAKSVLIQSIDNPAPSKSLLSSYAFDESKTFIPCYITKYSTMKDFEQFLRYFLPGDRYREQRVATKRQYPVSSDQGSWNRAHAIIQDSSFTCNTRVIFDTHYNTKSTTPTYMMHCRFFGALGYALDASDLMRTYWNQDLTFKNFTNSMNHTNKLCDSWIPNSFGINAFVLVPCSRWHPVINWSKQLICHEDLCPTSTTNSSMRRTTKWYALSGGIWACGWRMRSEKTLKKQRYSRLREWLTGLSYSYRTYATLWPINIDAA